MALVLETSEERYIRSLLRSADSSSPAAVVLVGSAAREAPTSPTSDIDILTIGIDTPKSTPPRIQVLALTENRLRERINERDDFAQWALRFGKPLAGRAYWHRLREELLPHMPWPSSDRKRKQAALRLEFAERLTAMGDDNAASEELRFALSHLARGVLLESNVFPLARGELPGQLRTIGDTELAEALKTSSSEVSVNSQSFVALLRLTRNRLHQSS